MAAKAETIIAWVAGGLALAAIGFIIYEEVQKAKKKKLVTDGNPNPGGVQKGIPDWKPVDPVLPNDRTSASLNFLPPSSNMIPVVAASGKSVYNPNSGITGGLTLGTSNAGGGSVAGGVVGGSIIGANAVWDSRSQVTFAPNNNAPGNTTTNFGGVFSQAPVAITGIAMPSKPIVKVATSYGIR